MPRLSELKEMKVSPDAPEVLKRHVESYNWALKNYSQLQEKHGREKYIAILDCKVVGETSSLCNQSRIDLLYALEVRFKGEDEAICIIPL